MLCLCGGGGGSGDGGGSGHRSLPASFKVFLFQVCFGFPLVLVPCRFMVVLVVVVVVAAAAAAAAVVIEAFLLPSKCSVSRFASVFL
jgi:hypothetical protein